MAQEFGLRASMTQGYIGVLYPHHEWQLSAAVAGLVDEVTVMRGDSVRSGQPLLHLESASQRIETERRRVIWENQAELESLRERLVILERMFVNARTLFQESGSISQDELSRMEVELLALRGRQRELQADRERQRLEWRLAEAELQQRSVHAPSDGVISRIEVNRGEWVSPGEPVLALVDLSVLELRANVPASAIAAVERGTWLAVDLPSLGLEQAGARVKVDFVSPVADAGSGLVEIRLLLENPDPRLRPGLQAILRQEGGRLISVTQ